MADSACYIELASNNGDFFTNSLLDDIMIRPQYATQKILIGTSNGLVPSLTVTSNNVGIGTTTPGYKLDISGDINFTGSLLQNGTAWSSSTGSQWSNNAANVFLLGSNVGIGTNSPQATVHINDDFYIAENNANWKSSAGKGIFMRYSTNGAQDGAFIQSATRTTGVLHNMFIQGSNIRIGSEASGSTTPSIYIQNDGKTGIGTTTPTEKLQVSSGKIYCDTQILDTANDSATVPGFSFKENSNTGIFHAATDTIGFSTGGTEKLRIDSIGNVGLGTAGPVHKLETNGSIMVAGNNTYISMNANNFNAPFGLIKKSGVSPSFAFTSNFLATNVANSMRFEMISGTHLSNLATEVPVELMRLTNAGNLGIGTTTPTYKLDVNGYSRLGQTYTFNETTPIGIYSGNRRYALLATVGANAGFSRIQGIAGGHDSASGGQGKCKFDITIDGRNTSIRGNVANLYGNNSAGIVVYKDNTSGNLTVYLTGENYLRHNTLVYAADTGTTVSTTLSWSSDTAWTTPSGTTLYFDTVSHIPSNVIGTDFYLTTAATPVYGTTTLTSGNVGIGASNPSYKLDVQGGTVGITNTGGKKLQFGNDAATNRHIVLFEDANDEHQYYGFGVNSATLRYQVAGTAANHIFYAATSSSASTELMRIQGTGNVGIGTSSPSYKLDVNGTIKGTNYILPNDAWINSADGRGRLYFTANARSYYGSFDGHEWRRSNDGTMMVLTNGGNLGIGTTSPAYSLHVASNTSTGAIIAAEILNTTSFSGFAARNSGSTVNGGMRMGILGTGWTSSGIYQQNGGFLECDQSNGISIAATSNSGSVRFYSGGTTEVMRVNSNQNVGIGTTSPSSALHVVGKVIITSNAQLYYEPILDVKYIDNTQGIGIGYATIAATGTSTNQDININPKGTGDVKINTSTGYVKVTKGSGLVTLGSSNTTGGGFVSVGNGAEMFNAASNWPTYGIGCSPAGKVNIQGYYELSLGTDANTVMTLSRGGNVGIGTTTPTEKIHVASGKIYSDTQLLGNSNDSVSVPSFSFKEDSNTGIFHAASDALGITTGGAERLRVDASGYVGIGTTSPHQIVHLHSASQTWFKITNDILQSTTWDGFRMGVWTDGSANFYHTSNFPMIFTTGATERMRINGTDGNVGIGTTNPSYKLDVNGTTRIKGTGTNGASNLLVLENQSTGRIQFVDEFGAQPCGMASMGTGNGIGIYAGTSIGFYTSNLSSSNAPLRMTITQAGNVGIGTSSPSYTLDVSGTINATGYVGTNYFQINSNAGIARIGSSGTGGMYLSLNQGQTMYIPESNWPSYGIGCSSGGSVGIHGYYGITLGTQNTTTMTIGGGNVGIGTTSPSYKLDVQGTVGITNTGGKKLQLSNDITTNRHIVLYETANNEHQYYGFGVNNSILRYQVSASNGNHVFYSAASSSASTELMRIQGTGNVGIGNGSPAYKLDVNGDMHAGNNGCLMSGTTSGFLRMVGVGNATYIQSGLSNTNNSAAPLVFGTINNATEWARFDNAGNLGIGTNAPSAKVYVNGNSILNGGNQIVVQNGQDGGTGRGIYMWLLADTNWGIYMGQSGASKSLAGATAVAGNDGITAHAIRIRVGILSTQGFIVENSAESLLMSVRASDGLTYIAGNTTLNNTTIGNSGFGGGYACFAHSNQFNIYSYALLHESSGQTYINCASGQAIRFRENNGDVAIITGSKMGILTQSPSYQLHVVGTIYATGDIIGFSDKRLKSNITIIDSALSKIHKLNGYTFNLQDDNKTHTGLIAQEVLEVLPEAVHQEKKADGTDGYYSLAYGNMAGLFVEAIKEIDNKYKSQITDLQETVSILRQEIDLLKNKL